MKKIRNIVILGILMYILSLDQVQVFIGVDFSHILQIIVLFFMIIVAWSGVDINFND